MPKTRCTAELCRNWTGSGCVCDVLGLDPEPTPEGEAVERMLTDPQAPTCTLDEYIEAEKADDNLFWRISCGHHQNLLDDALFRLNSVYKANEMLIAQNTDLRERYDRLRKNALGLGPVPDKGTP